MSSAQCFEQQLHLERQAVQQVDSTNMKQPCSFKTIRTTQPPTLHYIPDDLNL